MSVSGYRIVGGASCGIVLGMDYLLVLFFPAFISIKILNYLRNNALLTRDLVMYYGVFVTTIALVAHSLMRAMYPEYTTDFIYGISVRYLTIAVIFSIVLPFAIELATKAFDINIDYKKK